MKAILISIKPEYVEKILNGEKTVEIRKAIPKCDLPCKVYIYCTKNKGKGDCLFKCGSQLSFVVKWAFIDNVKFLNGKIVAEFTLNKVEEFTPYWDEYDYWLDDDNLKETCLTRKQIWNYGKGKNIYAWYIDNLKIYDKPKDLSHFKKANCQQIINKLEYMGCDELYCNSQVNTTMCLDDAECDYNCCPKLRITRPPQSWCYVEDI